jgi:hypothetical protein
MKNADVSVISTNLDQKKNLPFPSPSIFNLIPTNYILICIMVVAVVVVVVKIITALW